MKTKKEKQHHREIRELTTQEAQALLHDRKALTARAVGSVKPVVSAILHIFIWVTLAISVVVQLLALIGIAQKNARVETGNFPGETSFNSAPLMMATVFLLVFTIWFMLCRSRLRWVPFVASIGVGVLFVFVALQLYGAFQLYSASSGVDQGLTVVKMIFRHMSPVLIPLLMIPTLAVDGSIRATVSMEEALLRGKLQETTFDGAVLPREDSEKPKTSVKSTQRKHEENT